MISKKGYLTALTNLSKYITALWRENAVSLLAIVVLGIAIGGAAYGLYRYTGQRLGSRTVPVEEIAQPTVAQKPESLEPTTVKSTTTVPKSNEQEPKGKSAAPAIKGNFSKKGAVFAREDGWTLLWDEPGKLALNVKLKFTDQSICILGGEKKDCGLINMGPESYNRASVEGDRVGDEVTVIKMEELPSYE